MAHPHPDDLALLGVEPILLAEDGRSGTLVLGSGLVRHDGALYGGTGLALSVLAMAAAARRDVLWATTQFVSSPQMGSRIDWVTDVLAEGRRATQLRVTASVEGTIVFTALGSAGVSADDGLTGRYRTGPTVSAPEASALWQSPGASSGGVISGDSWIKLIELREAEIADRAPNQTALWARRRDGRPFSPVAIAFVADFVPVAVARSAGKLGAGSSLDNSMRFRPGSSDEWVLIEVVGDFASGGFGHGTVRAWAPDGELLGTGSQSASMRYMWDPGDAPQLPSSG